MDFRNGSNKSEAIKFIQEKSYPLKTEMDLKPLMDRIGGARIVMLGEASHGTHEYYTWRSYITKKLIEEKGFNFIAVEGDWPDCYKLNRYIKQYTQHQSATEVLNDFNRWPTWMWANWEIVALAEWLHSHNSPLSLQHKVGFYGLDVYSLWDSLESIKKFLEKTNGELLSTAIEAFNCFEPYKKDDGKSYAFASQMVPELCENEVVTLLEEITAKMPHFDSDYEMAFSAKQNAHVAVNAEKYYRAMIKGGPHSWNVRDTHMFETLQRLLDFHGEKSKVIVWEHNTHIGDSSATDMADEGMFNIGELARHAYSPDELVLVGFGSYKGSVIASKSWGAEMQEMSVPEGRPGSWEEILHLASAENKLLLMDDFLTEMFLENRIDHRAIGVVYHPGYEYMGNYVPTILPLRYDAFLYFEETSGLHPLHIHPSRKKVPETFPFGV